MREHFLHFVWQHQFFDKKELRTTAGESLNIIHPGFQNQDAGPDFSNAKVRIDSIDWHGQVEIHVKSSAWYQHKHQEDPAYANTILHVVWQDDRPVTYKDGSGIPTVELGDRVEPLLLQNSELLVSNPDPIPCRRRYPVVAELTKISMKERALIDRLDTKSTGVLLLNASNGNDWEETAYQWLAKSMGFKLNADAMLQLSRSLPLQTLKKHHLDIFQLEALLFGIAGMLKHAKDQYAKQLAKEFSFLAHKYRLEGNIMHPVTWRFMRTRPSNFPTIRIAQLARIIAEHPSIFSLLHDFNQPADLLAALKVSPSPYWQAHYRFGSITEAKVGNLGKSSVENIVINAAAPLLVAYGKHTDNEQSIEKVTNLLLALSAESNKITRLWEGAGESLSTAFDSQGLLSLYKLYCTQKRCLSCGIGVEILRDH